jgi:hypothetical protein
MTVQILFLTAALAAGAAATQQPATSAPRPPAGSANDPTAVPTTRPSTAALVTVEGCVASENEIPGRKENVAERVGLAEDFILTSAKVVRGQAPSVPRDTSGGLVSAALRPMYEIGGLTAEQLKVHVGRRVRIEGHFGNLDGERPSDPKNDDLIELNAATIRQVPGDCAVPRS